MTIDEEKKQLRSLIKRKVASLSNAYCQQADAGICQRVRALDEYKKAKTIFAYVGRYDEINTKPLIMQALAEQKRVGVPLCIGKGFMEVREIRGLEDLQDGPYGIQEPRHDLPLLQPGDIDIAVIPCLTCNTKGERLGYGGGFYDRYLEKSSFLRVILCRQQIMVPTIPTDSHDIPMDVVISEVATIYV